MSQATAPIEVTEPALRLIDARDLPDPLVKWVGSKRRILPAILGRLPEACDRYVEPFAGSAAVFFAYHKNAKRSILADVNHDLICMYTAVASRCRDVEALTRFHADAHSEPHYYSARDEFNAREYLPGSAHHAALFLYLNRACFNGLWRVNRKTGKFNVPSGKRKTVHVPSSETFVNAWAALNKAEKILTAPFDLTLKLCGPGDVVYVDPPYPGTFDSYAEDGFSSEQHGALADQCFAAAARGAHVLVSINDCELARFVYQPRGGIIPVIDAISVRHAVGATEARRKDVPELLITLKK